SLGGANFSYCCGVAPARRRDFQHLSAVGSVVQSGGCGAPGAAATRHARLIRAPLPPDQSARSARRARPLKRTALLANKRATETRLRGWRGRIRTQKRRRKLSL